MSITPGLSATATGNSATVALPVPAHSTGDVLFAWFNTNTATVTTAPSGWTLSTSGSAAPVIPYLYRIFDTAGTISGTINWSLSASDTWGGGIQAFSGVDSSVWDSGVPPVMQSGTGTTNTMTGITTVTAGCLILAPICHVAPSTTFTDPAGYTESWQTTSKVRNVFAYKTQATAGATGSVTYTSSANRAWGGFVGALKPAGGAAPVNHGTASTGWTATATASGSQPLVPVNHGTASTGWTATATASGSQPLVPVNHGTASTGWTATATASGSQPQVGVNAGTASTSWTATATASGSQPLVPVNEGTAAVSWTATATASGSQPAVGVNTGTASTSWTATATASGSQPAVGVNVGTASTSWTATATASGSQPLVPVNEGTAAVSWTMTATASGSNAGIPEPPLVINPVARLTLNLAKMALTANHATANLMVNLSSAVVSLINLATGAVTANAANATLRSILTSGVVTPNGYTAQWRFLSMSQWKTGDTWPPLEVTLLDGGTPVDLTNITAVKLHVAPAAPATITINAAMEVYGTPTDGVVRYLWQPGDLNEAGTFRIEVEVTWADGGIQTFPPQSYLSYTVTEELDTTP